MSMFEAKENEPLRRQAHRGNPSAFAQINQSRVERLLRFCQFLTEDEAKARLLADLALRKYLARRSSARGSSKSSVASQQKALSLVLDYLDYVGSGTMLQKKLTNRYHALVDRNMRRRLSETESAELKRIERILEAIEDSQTSEIQLPLEDQHRETMQKLTDLILELRRIAGPAEHQPEAR
jgi:hypothetical protein